ncbi:MAG: WYL domain-containing protein [Nocardioides sp.]|nr:WYL domain-containing protein [Nocardioides sp.]
MSGPQRGGGGARDQVARLLVLVPYLHARGSVSLGEAAEALGTEPRQLLRDLKVLFMCGLPGGLPDDLIDVDIDALETEDGVVRDDGVIRVSNADYLARPLRLTPVEASAVLVALESLEAVSEADTREVIGRARDKIAAAVARGTGDAEPLPVHAAQEDGGAAQRVLLASRLRDAVAARRQVRLDYYVPARDELSHRVVDPHRVVEHAGTPYLDAWCHTAEAPRLFRLDRVSAAEVLDSEITTEPTEPRDLSAGVLDAGDATTVTLRLAPAARWVTEYYAVQEVRPVGEQPADGSAGDVEVDLLVADERWLTRLLLRLSPHATVVSPPGLDAVFTEAAGRALRLYEDTDVR